MAHAHAVRIERFHEPTTSSVVTQRPGYQAYQILHIGFTVAPIVAGIDKFFHVLVNWDQYLAPAILGVLPFDGHTFMMVVGAVEIVAGLLVLLKPRIGAYLVSLWLLAIIANLLIAGRYYDIALRDFGLCLAALALGRLSTAYSPQRAT